MLLEDELGQMNLIVPPPVYERYRAIVRGEPLLLARGTLRARTTATCNVARARSSRRSARSRGGSRTTPTSSARCRRRTTSVIVRAVEEPVTRYARSGDVNIAYQVLGEGPFDVVWVPGCVSHVELDWKIRAPCASTGASRRSAG